MIMNIFENNAIKISYKDFQFTFTDKRINKEWKQSSISSFNPSSPVVNGNTISFTIESDFVKYNVEMEIENQCEIIYTISSRIDEKMTQLAFPTAIVPPDENHYVVQTDSEGLLLPVTDSGYPLEQQPVWRCSGGPGMAWIGMVDFDLESGYMHIYETPCDTEVSLEKYDGLISFKPVWLSTKKTFGYQRRLRIVFFDNGGYVAQCKRYRPYAWKEHKVISLKERLNRFPKMEKMLGAVHIYTWGSARATEFLQDLKDNGIDRAFILWDPNHLPYPSSDYSRIGKEFGFAMGGYNIFTDILEETPKVLEAKRNLPVWVNVYPGQFEYLTAKTAEGKTYSNIYGNFVCPAVIQNEIKKRFDFIMERYAFEAFFLDVYVANGLYECYDERHPLTREGYKDSMLKNYAYVEDNYETYMGGEFGSDFGAGHVCFAHGMMTLQRTWFDSIVTIPGSIYYTGSWKNHEEPEAMVGNSTASPDYMKYAINEYTRVPLYELVYHDAVVTSWRWEDGNNHNPEIWWKKDLFNALYGNSPLWSVSKESFLKHNESFKESYNKIIPWIKSIACDEMISHSFESADHKIQKAAYSSGKAIVVNFGDEDYNYNSTTIPARDFVTI